VQSDTRVALSMAALLTRWRRSRSCLTGREVVATVVVHLIQKSLRKRESQYDKKPLELSAQNTDTGARPALAIVSLLTGSGTRLLEFPRRFVIRFHDRREPWN
jgi:hypothetical protein